MEPVPVPRAEPKRAPAGRLRDERPEFGESAPQKGGGRLDLGRPGIPDDYQPAVKPEQVLDRLERALAFPQIAQDVLKTPDVVGRRQIVQAIGSNWRVRDRKALYTANKPFSFLKESTASSLWWTVAEDVRTWLLCGADQWVPDFENPLSESPVTRSTSAD